MIFKKILLTLLCLNLICLNGSDHELIAISDLMNTILKHIPNLKQALDFKDKHNLETRRDIRPELLRKLYGSAKPDQKKSKS